MYTTHKLRIHYRLHHLLFIIQLCIVIALLAWLSSRYVYRADWTYNNSNSLSESTIVLLKTLPSPIKIVAYSSDNPEIRLAIRDLIARYQQHKKDIQLVFIDPVENPQQARAEGISMDGELIIYYQERSEHLQTLSEQAISNNLQRLARSNDQQLVFVQGHGERSPEQENNYAISIFTKQLKAKGFKIKTVNLTHDRIPENTATLIIASPQVAYLPNEVNQIQAYLQQGGNLLWLNDPDVRRHHNYGLTPLAEQLSIEFLPGTIVDPSTQAFGLENPSIAIIAQYQSHPITQGFDKLTLFPQALPISELPDFSKTGWHSNALLQTIEQSWSETSTLQGTIQFDDNDIKGSLSLGFAIWRTIEDAETPFEQRIVVIGDGDFMSNTYLGNVGNLHLSMNIINWLSHDDNLMHIPIQQVKDVQLNLSDNTLLSLAFIFLIFIPLFFFSSGFIIWIWRRKK